MVITVDSLSAVTLSICITTFNRAEFIGETIESILAQVTDDCEVVILDGASTDETERVVLSYADRWRGLRYMRQASNNGFDRDCDRAVELARGRYCWLMTDDDLVRPGAIATVLSAIHRDPSLILLNAEDRDLSMSRVLQRRWLNFESDRVYAPSEMDRLFMEMGEVLQYVGAVVIKRSIWLSRQREQYYGTSFVFVGVIFQAPLPGETLVIADPLISYRRGNTHAWLSRAIEILCVGWPALVRSLALSESTKRMRIISEPWKDRHMLLLYRAVGSYSLSEYRRLIRPRLRSMADNWSPMMIALIPCAVANALLVLYYSVTGRSYRGLYQSAVLIEELRGSRFYFRNWRFLRSEAAASRQV